MLQRCELLPPVRGHQQQLAPAIPLVRYEWDRAPQQGRKRARYTGALFSVIVSI